MTNKKRFKKILKKQRKVYKDNTHALESLNHVQAILTNEKISYYLSKTLATMLVVNMVENMMYITIDEEYRGSDVGVSGFHLLLISKEQRELAQTNIEDCKQFITGGRIPLCLKVQANKEIQ